MDANHSHASRVVLADPGELISAVPHVLGIHPADSIVVVGLDGHDGLTFSMALRGDLSSPAEYRTLAAHLLLPLIMNEAAGAVLIVVGGTDTYPPAALPYRELIDVCSARFASDGVPVLHTLWAASTTIGSPWRSYDHPESCGTVPDSSDSVIARACACDATGIVVHDRREDLAATLAPVSDDVLVRRADLLKATGATAGDSSVTGPAGLDLVESWVERATSGIFPWSDEDVVELAVALTDHAVRDACLDLGDRARASAAEQLWTTLVRNTPAPEQSEAASLLAFAAYGRGDGVLVSIATECALQADPSHRLAGLIDAARSIGLSPGKIRHAATQAAGFARSALADTASEGPQQ